MGCGLWAVCVRANRASERAPRVYCARCWRVRLCERQAKLVLLATAYCVQCTLLLCALLWPERLELPARPLTLASRVSDCVMCLRSDVWPAAGWLAKGQEQPALFCARLPRILHANVHCWRLQRRAFCCKLSLSPLHTRRILQSCGNNLACPPCCLPGRARLTLARSAQAGCAPSSSDSHAH